MYFIQRTLSKVKDGHKQDDWPETPRGRPQGGPPLLEEAGGLQPTGSKRAKQDSVSNSNIRGSSLFEFTHVHSLTCTLLVINTLTVSQSWPLC